jgi:hypothetical protein
MQRANGDWFAIKDSGRFRVPLFSSHSEAMGARSFNVEMLVFKPALIDERALNELEKSDDQRPFYFWLVEKASRTMRRGVALQREQIALILSGADVAS